MIRRAGFSCQEMLNAANWGYSIDDYVSLYKEKAQFAEPDVVILSVNGNDILDMYFSHRNRFSRNKQPQNPSQVEKNFYQKKLGKNEHLLQVGEVAKSLHVICKGAIIAYFIDEKGNTYNKNIFLEKNFAGSKVSCLKGIPSEFALETLEDS